MPADSDNLNSLNRWEQNSIDWSDIELKDPTEGNIISIYATSRLKRPFATPRGALTPKGKVVSIDTGFTSVKWTNDDGTSTIQHHKTSDLDFHEN